MLDRKDPGLRESGNWMRDSTRKESVANGGSISSRANAATTWSRRLCTRLDLVSEDRQVDTPLRELTKQSSPVCIAHGSSKRCTSLLVT